VPDLLLLTDLSTDDDAPAHHPRRPAAADVRRAPTRRSRPACARRLILQTVLGFDAATIASAFLIAPATWASDWCAPRPDQQAGIPFRLPDHDDLPEAWPACSTRLRDLHRGLVDPAGTEAAAATRRRGHLRSATCQRAMPDEPRRSACSR